jgi:hypothetical protein
MSTSLERCAMTVVGWSSNGQPRTYRRLRPARNSGYRRLTIAILGLDVATLTAELRNARRQR